MGVHDAAADGESEARRWLGRPATTGVAEEGFEHTR
jgi:hypothetical protein